MSSGRIRRMLGMLLAASGAACFSVQIEPPAGELARVRTSARRALAFDFHEIEDFTLVDASSDPKWRRTLDGEDLAEATARFRELLDDADVFGPITRAAPGSGLHCDLRLRRYGAVSAGGIFLALSLGLIPESQRDEYELECCVTAPGREARTYRARTHASCFLWLPLAPVGLVQTLTQRGALQQTVDGIVAQMAADGWLDS